MTWEWLLKLDTDKYRIFADLFLDVDVLVQ